MKGLLQILAVGLLAVDGAVASKCRPSKSASSSSASSSVSSASSSVSSASSSVSSSSVSSSSSISSSSSVVPSSSSVVPSSSPIPSSSSSSIVVSSSSSSSAIASPSAPCAENAVNGNFANALTDWTPLDTNTAATVFTDQCSTDFADCAELMVLANGDVADIYQSMNLVPGVTYTMSIVYAIEYPGQSQPVSPNFGYGVLGSQPTRRRSLPSLHHRGKLALDPRDSDNDNNVLHPIPITNFTSSSIDHSNAAKTKRAPLPVRQFTTFSTSIFPTGTPIYLLFQASADAPMTVYISSVSVKPAGC